MMLTLTLRGLYEACSGMVGSVGSGMVEVGEDRGSWRIVEVIIAM